ncbi:MAG: bifunctional folylpolyglutamate synthase/dihydrofolate synthase [Verrucomicrobia bacterium]|nr:bifunctional folylpolyglutamate synthase/dihydrofolate synthase [Verrucomicrobiota bacterium]
MDQSKYSEILNWLYGTQNRGVKLGLENVRALLREIGDPQQSLACIHVAGTNGKGSVCAMLAAICREMGLRTGLFTSPHLVRYNERIQINGEAISNDEIVSRLTPIRQTVQDWSHPPTFFELSTALAFQHFRAEYADIVILETGLGGRLDATNVVQPLVSVLTSIDLDHERILGNTVAEIAGEKAGIIKRGAPAVSLSQYPEVRVAFENAASRVGTQLHWVEEPLTDWAIGLAGEHQKLNAALALKAVALAGLNPNETAARDGLAGVSWPGRFQAVEPRLILDGAHNPPASRQLAKTWKEVFGTDRATIVFGGLRDKRLTDMLSELAGIAERFVFVPVRNDRGENPENLSTQVQATVAESLLCGLRIARRYAAPILVTGSLYLVGEALALLDPSWGYFEVSTQ